MSRKHHYLKCETEPYQAHEKGIKTYELRINDRDYKINDMVYLQEVVNGIKTGRSLQSKEIVYITYGGKYGLNKDYCILQLK